MGDTARALAHHITALEELRDWLLTHATDRRTWMATPMNPFYEDYEATIKSRADALSAALSLLAMPAAMPNPVPMTSPFTPPPEDWIKSVRDAWRVREPFIARALSPHAQEELADAAIAVLAPMIAEECAKVADMYAKAYAKEHDTHNIAAAIRSKFPSVTGEKGE